MKTLGIILIVAGIAMMLFTGFNIITKEKVVDAGPIEISKEKKTPVYWSPIAGGVLLAAGVIVMLADRKRSLV